MTQQYQNKYTQKYKTNKCGMSRRVSKYGYSFRPSTPKAHTNFWLLGAEDLRTCCIDRWRRFYLPFPDETDDAYKSEGVLLKTSDELVPGFMVTARADKNRGALFKPFCCCKNILLEILCWLTFFAPRGFCPVQSPWLTQNIFIKSHFCPIIIAA